MNSDKPRHDSEGATLPPEVTVESSLPISEQHDESAEISENRLSQFLENLASYADAVQRKLLWPLGIGGLATVYWLWVTYSPESALWWNLTKSLFVALPMLVWGFIWILLGQLREAPTLAAKLTSRPDSMLANLNTSNFKQKVGIRGLFSTLKAFREEEGLDIVLDTIGSVTLIINPIFALLASIMMVLLFMLILITPLALIF